VNRCNDWQTDKRHEYTNTAHPQKKTQIMTAAVDDVIAGSQLSEFQGP
jgi:hypothetical protein